MRHLALCLLATAVTATAGLATTVEIARPQDPITPGFAAESRATDDLRALRDATGAAWRTWSVNGATGTVHLAYGSGVNLGVGSVITEADADAAARAFVATHESFFHVDPADLELWRASSTPDKWGVNFHQLHDGLRVLGGRVNVTMTREGRVFVVGSDIYRDIDVSTISALSGEAARSIAAAPLDGIVRDGALTPTLMILPVHGDATVSHHLVWQVEHWTDDPMGHWYSYVDAHTGDILWRQSAVYHLDVSGTVSAVVEDFDQCAGPSVGMLENMRVEIVETGDSTLTDADGNFVIPSGTDPVTLELEFRGPWVDVNRHDTLPDPTDAVLNVPAIPGTPVAVDWDTLSSRWDERDVFFHTNRVHGWLKNVDPDYTGLDYPVPATVGINLTCNATWDGVGMNFYREGGGCANTGRLGGVVYHEYGHGITWFLYDDAGGQPPSSLHEGNSDVAANLVEKQSLIGNGFYLTCEEGIRNSDNTLCWPLDANASGHHNGQMLAGFFWEARANLMATLGESAGEAKVTEVWHFGRKMGLPYTFEDQVFWTFVADDDNGDLDDGTPNYADLCSAAEFHCFVCPDFGVEFRHQAFGPLRTAGAMIPVESRIWSTLAPLDPATLMVRYSVDGGAFLEVPLSGDPADSTYTASIPAQPAGTVLTYYLSAADDIGTVGTDPEDAPASVHTVQLSPTVWDDFEADLGWQAGVPGDDATDGLWERVDPNGTYIGGTAAFQPEDDNSVPGTQCFVTGQTPPGELPQNGDIDGGTTTLRSPVFNLSGATSAVVHYHRWFTDDLIVSSPEEEYWVVQVRNDASAWIDLENTTDSDNRWIPMAHDLIPLFGGGIGEIEVQFLGNDLPPGNTLVEAAVDDFYIVTDLGGGTVAVDPVSPTTPSVTALAPARPNPMLAGTSVRYQLAAAGDVQLGVYDVTGRRVRLLVDTRQEIGQYAVRWDGTGDDGRRVGAGVYFTELRVGATRYVEKLTIVR